MVVWALRGDRRRPGLLRRRRAARARARTARAANAGWGEGEWVVAEADESDASFLGCGPRSRSSPTSRWTTTPAGARWPSCSRPSREFAEPGRRPRSLPADGCARPGCAGAAARSRGFDADAPRPGRARSWRSPAATTAPTPAPRSPRSSSAGLDARAGAAAALAELPRRARGGSSSRARAAAPASTTTTPTTRPRSRAALAALRELEPDAPDRRLPAPPLLAHQGAAPSEFGAALAARRRGRGARRLPGPRGAGRRARRGQRPAGRRRRRPSAVGGRPVWWLPEPTRPSGRWPSASTATRPRRAATSWSRSAPATSASSARRWSRRDER